MAVRSRTREAIKTHGGETQVTFTVQVPNSTTVEAMKELEDGKGRRFDSAEELFRDLDI